MRIFAVLPKNPGEPCGGVRQFYRHVDVLLGLGYDAVVMQPDASARPSWFDCDTPVVSIGSETPSPDDVFVLPEISDGLPPIPGIVPEKVVVYAQNPNGVLSGFGGMPKVMSFYRRVLGVLCVSEHSRVNLSGLLPFAKVRRVKYFVGRYPFGQTGTKEKVIAYMPRRLKAETNEVLNILSAKGTLRGWRVLPVDGMHEKDVAAAMGKAMVFLSSSHREGFGLPPAEVMSCGCVVAGWTGGAGGEFMLPQHSYPADGGDPWSCVKAVGTAVSETPSMIEAIVTRAMDFILSCYSEENERKTFDEAWKELLS